MSRFSIALLLVSMVVLINLAQCKINWVSNPNSAQWGKRRVNWVSNPNGPIGKRRDLLNDAQAYDPRDLDPEMLEEYKRNYFANVGAPFKRREEPELSPETLEEYRKQLRSLLKKN